MKNNNNIKKLWIKWNAKELLNAMCSEVETNAPRIRPIFQTGTLWEQAYQLGQVWQAKHEGNRDNSWESFNDDVLLGIDLESNSIQTVFKWYSEDTDNAEWHDDTRWWSCDSDDCATGLNWSGDNGLLWLDLLQLEMMLGLSIDEMKSYKNEAFWGTNLQPEDVRICENAGLSHQLYL